MGYILITFYNRGSSLTPIWEVYGHRKKYDNDHLGTFETAQEVMSFAHQHGIPVLRGTTAHSIKILDILSRHEPDG